MYYSENDYAPRVLLQGQRRIQRGPGGAQPPEDKGVRGGKRLEAVLISINNIADLSTPYPFLWLQPPSRLFSQGNMLVTHEPILVEPIPTPANSVLALNVRSINKCFYCRSSRISTSVYSGHSKRQGCIVEHSSS
ncbi:hypothetical protein J6590_056018 [Homalodisca vitripennis]|nr:hypothetical protein J6590_056018 [Homalodisca vitripennis]